MGLDVCDFTANICPVEVFFNAWKFENSRPYIHGKMGKCKKLILSLDILLHLNRSLIQR